MTKPVSSETNPTHISVCICTYKRPEWLAQLLSVLSTQKTGGRFTYSIVVVDNDRRESARAVVEEVASKTSVSISYDVEPRRNIALARNKAVESASGDFLALVDDDEEPVRDWLLRLLEAVDLYEADGVLGPVLPRFVSSPPAWVVRAECFGTKPLPSGTKLRWDQTRTGNVLLRRRVVENQECRFRPEYALGGEDVDFFRRMIARGFRFVWCAEGKVYESIPSERCSRRYLLRKALVRGRAPYNQGWPVLISLIAVPAYAFALPFLFVSRSPSFMPSLISAFDHLGRILASVGGKYWAKLLPSGHPE